MSENLAYSKIRCTFAAAKAKLRQGEVLEWLKRHAWKACNRQNRFAGSNPVLSAKKPINGGIRCRNQFVKMGYF